MAVMEGDDRVEIELTPNDPRRHRRPDREPATAPTADSANVEPWLSTATGRTVLIAGAVGVVALLVGLVVGRATTDGDDVASAPLTSGVATSNAPRRTDPTLPTLPPGPPNPTTRPPRPTTTTEPQIEASTIEVNAALAGAPYELVAIDHSGDVVRLDIATGNMTIRRDLDLMGGGGPSELWAGDGWVLVPDWNSGRLLLIADGEEPQRVAIEPWTLIETETAGEFWVFDQLGAPGTNEGRLVNRFGDALGATIELPEPPLFGDPLGGLVVISSGNTYRVAADGVSKITNGEVLALDAQHALARRCDDQLNCEYVVVDRATGESRPVDVPADFPRLRTDGWPPSDLKRIAPDGRSVAVTWTENARFAQILGVLDLESGAISELSRNGFSASVVWSPDGRFAFYLHGDRPMAHDLTTGEKFLVSSDLSQIDSLTIRPVSP